jgi:uncharacterized protein involved in exopolysaccharide biosynthesis
MSNTPQQTIKYPELKVLVGQFFKYALSQYKLFLIVCTLTAALGLVYGKLQPHTYKATSTFIVEDKSGSRGGGLSGLASQFGIDVGGLTGGGAGLFDGDNILEILKSRAIIEKVLLTKIQEDIPQKNKTLAEFYLSFSSLGDRLNSKGITLKSLNFTSIDEKSKHSLIQDSVLYLIYTEIDKGIFVEKKNKKSSIITLEANSNNAIFAKIFSENLLKKTSDMYIDIKTGNLSRSIEKIQHKTDSLQNIINNIANRSSKLNLPVVEQLVNENPSRKLQKENYLNKFTYSNVIPIEQTTRDRTVAYTLYAEMVKNLETLKLSLINQTPVIQVIDAAKYPLFDQRTPARYFLLIGFAVGFVLSLFYIVFKYTS